MVKHQRKKCRFLNFDSAFSDHLKQNSCKNQNSANPSSDRPFVFLDWSEFYNRRAGRCCSSRDQNGHRSRWKCQTDQSCSRKRTTTPSTYIQTFSYLSVCHQALNHCHQLSLLSPSVVCDTDTITTRK